MTAYLLHNSTLLEVQYYPLHPDDPDYNPDSTTNIVIESTTPPLDDSTIAELLYHHFDL